MGRETQIRLSAEWAAYGDALGFITELADSGRVQYRIGAEEVRETVAWKRKVGGYNGVSIDLPAGSYSDDTQLRLSTSRAIRADGTFDVAAFAKVELPAWANYALGAGAGSKEAASNLARTSATWYSNFFDSKRASYVSAGGNGAAMRVQPHVWAARDLSETGAILLDVVRNSVCTHGHPRGILGACFHALTLAFALDAGRPATMPELRQIIEDLRSVPKIVENDGDLRLFWLGAWEEASKIKFREGVAQVLTEMSGELTALEALHGRKLADIYPRAVDAVGAIEPASRGSGTKTAMLAAFAALLADVSDPKQALLTLVNVLGSDTDSIATMAAAIIGACTDRECEGTVQDKEYIQSEARRLSTVAQGGKSVSFRYPDLRTWKPARAAVDAVGLLDGQLWLNGLSALEPVDGSEIKEIGSDRIVWCRLSFGQTILARVRSRPNPINPARAAAHRQEEKTEDRPSPHPPGKLRDLFGQVGSQAAPRRGEPPNSLENQTLNDVLQSIISQGFSPELIGQALLQQVDRGGTDFVERGIALTANILTAYEARSKRRRN
ncbi:MAG TPA: ADP-ribosylglycohydrolase family protein [Allosphingosinicella sp.]